MDSKTKIFCTFLQIIYYVIIIIHVHNVYYTKISCYIGSVFILYKISKNVLGVCLELLEKTLGISTEGGLQCFLQDSLALWVIPGEEEGVGGWGEIGE